METYNNYSMTANTYDILDSLKTLLPQRSSLRDMYGEKPITMHKSYPSLEPMKYPVAIRKAYAAIWSGKHQRIIIKAPRGGGKSKLLGTVGFDLWYLKGRKVVNMAGSAVQATVVYNYFKDYCDIDVSIENYIDGEPLAIMTKSVLGNTFASVTASTKQIRGKHPDALISDETCETSDELVYAALPMVNDSKHPLIVLASTFHKIYGVFQETWDNAAEKGYLRIQWDIFDVCSQFPADIWENGVMPDGTMVKDVLGVEKLIEYAKGRTGDPEGWIPVINVIQAWREKPSQDWFEVEYLGSRPSAAGLVLKPEHVEAAMLAEADEITYRYIVGAECVLGIDWGFSSMTAVTEYMAHLNKVVVMLDNKNYSQIDSDTIIKAVVKRVREHGIRFIYADSAGKFENVALQNALTKANLPCKVIEVVFSKEKEGMLGNLRAHFESFKIKIPARFKDAYWQFKRYRYQPGTDKPIKKDDHIPDSSMCALQHFKLGTISRSLPTKTKPKMPGEKKDETHITHGLRSKVF